MDSPLDIFNSHIDSAFISLQSLLSSLSIHLPPLSDDLLFIPAPPPPPPPATSASFLRLPPLDKSLVALSALSIGIAAFRFIPSPNPNPRKRRLAILLIPPSSAALDPLSIHLASALERRGFQVIFPVPNAVNAKLLTRQSFGSVVPILLDSHQSAHDQVQDFLSYVYPRGSQSDPFVKPGQEAVLVGVIFTPASSSSSSSHAQEDLPQALTAAVADRLAIIRSVLPLFRTTGVTADTRALRRTVWILNPAEAAVEAGVASITHAALVAGVRSLRREAEFAVRNVSLGRFDGRMDRVLCADVAAVVHSAFSAGWFDLGRFKWHIGPGALKYTIANLLPDYIVRLWLGLGRTIADFQHSRTMKDSHTNPDGKSAALAQAKPVRSEAVTKAAEAAIARQAKSLSSSTESLKPALSSSDESDSKSAAIGESWIMDSGAEKEKE